MSQPNYRALDDDSGAQLRREIERLEQELYNDPSDSRARTLENQIEELKRRLQENME